MLTNLVFEVVFVFKNGIEVSVHANTVGEHLLLVVEEGVGAEVLGIVDVFVDSGAASAATDGVCGGPHVMLRSLALALLPLFNFFLG